MRLTLSLLALIAAPMFAVPVAHACSCLPYDTAEEQLAAADLVFEGQVINVATQKDERSVWSRMRRWFAGTDAPQPEQTLTTFQVFRTLKGEVRGDVVIQHLSGDWSSRCGTDFARGAPIMVIAYLGDEGEFRSSVCSQAQFPVQAYLKAAEMR